MPRCGLPLRANCHFSAIFMHFVDLFIRNVFSKTRECANPSLDGHPRCQRSRRFGRLPSQRVFRDLSDHTILADGGIRRRMVRRREKESLGCRAKRGGNAVGRRCRRRIARRVASRIAQRLVHRLTGTAANDPQHVQDRRGAHAVLPARHRPGAGDPRAQHFRRSLGRHGLPPDGIRHALRRIGAGSAGHGGDLTNGHPQVAGAVPSFLRWLPHLARGFKNRIAQRRRSGRAHRPGRRARPPRPRAHA